MIGLLLVGEASRGPGEPFKGRTGVRMANLLGTSFLARECDRVNLLPSWPGPSGRGKGDAFPAEPARAAAEMLLSVAPHRVVVLCGRRVASAFGLPSDAAWLSWTYRRGKILGLIPHPSGVVTWWNDAENVCRARAFVQEGVGLATSGAWRAS